MKSYATVFVLMSFLVACGEEPGAGQERAAARPVTEQAGILSGQQAYDAICAGCHEEGVDGAPKTGDRAAWQGRSWLWEAVLFEHAREGYDGMPGKGGVETLDEATVTRAAEYMLLLAFPERPPD